MQGLEKAQNLFDRRQPGDGKPVVERGFERERDEIRRQLGFGLINE